eukprot:TRINITY_DN26392_c0_g2_i1.p1 TRINITY_DN26392_c0_g2~~TRINITY_DN26392_c0_g2_i1.p1  ORF type:complete len:418 (+),score=77.32 TRINITY_DN26392_c0_g2_i1:70-1323(+)
MEPLVSVLMPCRNAMPWLPEAVASILEQEGFEERGGIELITVDDGSTDGSGDFLRAVAEELGARRRIDSDAAEQPPKRRKEGQAEQESSSESAVGRLGWQVEGYTPPTAKDVVARAVPGNSLVVLSVSAVGPSGQGLALNTAYRAARSKAYIGEMESDDLRPKQTFSTLLSALEANPDWSAAASEVELVGWDRPGMSRYVQWMNGLHKPDELARSRFIEIPSLRAAALYRREALTRVGPYRDMWEVDGKLVDCAVLDAPDVAPEDRKLPGWWPVDSDFWMRFFELGLKLGKVKSPPLYSWRQYPSQSTRTHSRCSLERLRACKVYFLSKEGAPAFGKRVLLFSKGSTLEGWSADLKAAGLDVEPYEWAPPHPLPTAAVEAHLPGKTVRLFAFGMPKVRARVLHAVRNFGPANDWFVS